MRSREEYEEFHERLEPSEVISEAEEEEPDGCPDCKHDEYCPGGCRTEYKPKYKFEAREKSGRTSNTA